MPVLPPNHTGVTRFTTSAGAATFATSPISFQNNSAWTIELWCSLDALVDFMPMVSKGTEFTLGSKGATLYAALGGQTVPLQSQPVLATSVPYYVAVTYDGLTMSLYLNGALAAQATTNANPPLTSTPLIVGGGFYGEVQELRLWTAAMNATYLGNNQFNAFPSGTSNLAAQVDFTVTPPADTSGNGFVPTLNGSAVYVRFVPAAALMTTSFCDPYNDEAVNPAGSQQPFSIAAWIAPSLTGYPMFIFANGVEESNSGTTLGIGSDGKLFFQVGDGPILYSQSPLQDGVWVEVAATWSSPNGVLYVNGVQSNTAINMTLAGSLASGQPLIGAIASVGAQLPIQSFYGQIQNVCVWNVALTADQVSADPTTTAQTDPTCVAYYDFSQPPAQNQISFNPVGLVAGTTLNPAPAYTGGGLPAPAGAFTPSAAVPSASAPAADADEFFGWAEEQFASFLSVFPLSDEQRAYFTNLHAERLRDGKRDFDAGTADNARVRITSLASGRGRMTYTHLDGTEEVISEDVFDPCTLWCIQLVTGIAAALWLALGLAFNYSKFLNGMTNFFGTRINSIGIMPQLNALFQNGVTGRSIYASLMLLYEYSLLTSIAKLSYQIIFSSLSWWTILSLGMRIVLLMSPTAVLEILWLIAQLAYSIYSITQIVQARPEGCLS